MLGFRVSVKVTVRVRFRVTVSVRVKVSVRVCSTSRAVVAHSALLISPVRV